MAAKTKRNARQQDQNKQEVGAGCAREVGWPDVNVKLSATAHFGGIDVDVIKVESPVHTTFTTGVLSFCCAVSAE